MYAKKREFLDQAIVILLSGEDRSIRTGWRRDYDDFEFAGANVDIHRVGLIE